MINETNDANTKRLRLYTKMLELKINPLRYEIITKHDQSAIFVVPAAIASDQAVVDSIIARYENIFREAF